MERAEAESEERVRPLFPDRRAGQCCWPMWGERTPFENKRCCGDLVSPGSKIPYCAEHLQRQTGERAVVRVTAKISKNGAPT